LADKKLKFWPKKMVEQKWWTKYWWQKKLARKKLWWNITLVENSLL